MDHQYVVVSIGHNVTRDGVQSEPDNMTARVWGVIQCLGEVVAQRYTVGEWDGVQETTLHALIKLPDHLRHDWMTWVARVRAAALLLDQECIAVRWITDGFLADHACLYWADGRTTLGGTLQDFPLPDGIVQAIADL